MQILQICTSIPDPMNNKAVILIGKLGAGKTYLLNKICQSNELSLGEGDSVTDIIYHKNAFYGSKFIILDTPGFGVRQSRFKQATMISAALELRPINKILLVVDYKRDSPLLDDIEDIFSLLQDHLERIVLVITHCDKMVNYEKEKQRIQKQIFCSKDTPGQEICKQIDEIISDSRAEMIQINDTLFITSFNLIDNKYNLTSQLRRDMNGLEIEFTKYFIAMRIFIDEYKNNDVDEVMHALTIWIKKMAELSVQKYELDNARSMDEIFEQTQSADIAYYYQMQLKKAIKKKLNEIIVHAQSKCMIDKNHFSNQLRACPSCGKIWLKEFGCSGPTTCGEKIQKHELRSDYKPPYSYVVIYDDVSRQIKIEPPKYLAKSLNVTATTKADKEVQEQGCGHILIWDELPKLSKIQIEYLMNIGIQDFLADKRDRLKEVEIFQKNKDNGIKQAIQNMSIDLRNQQHLSRDQQQIQEEQMKQTYAEKMDQQIITQRSLNFKNDDLNIQSNTQTAIFLGPKQSGKSTIIQESLQKIADVCKQVSIDKFITYEFKDQQKTYCFIDSIGLEPCNQLSPEKFKTQQQVFYKYIHNKLFNKIFIVCKYEQPISILQKHLEYCVIPFTQYKNRLTLIISHWDKCRNKKSEKNHIESMSKSLFGISQIIYSDLVTQQDLKSILKYFAPAVQISLKQTIFDCGNMISNEGKIKLPDLAYQRRLCFAEDMGENMNSDQIQSQDVQLQQTQNQSTHKRQTGQPLKSSQFQQQSVPQLPKQPIVVSQLPAQIAQSPTSAAQSPPTMTPQMPAPEWEIQAIQQHRRQQQQSNNEGCQLM